MSFGRRDFLWMACLGALIVPPVAARAQSGFEINMDELLDDTRNGRVVARGNVEIRYLGEILVADEVIYDRATRRVTAQGHIRLQEANGTVSRADALYLTSDLRDAFVAYLRRQKIPVDR